MSHSELLDIIEHGLPGTSRPKQIVIVGAGMAGLVAGELLKRAGHQVTLLEAQQRVGGRIYTARSGLAPGLRAEMGAIAFPQSHQLTMAYLERLHLPRAPLPVSNPSTYIHLQGKRMRRRDFDVGQFALGLHPQEARQAPEDLLKATFKPFFDLVQEQGEAGWEEILAHYDQFSLEGYLRQVGWSAGAIALVGILHNLESWMQSSLVSVLRQEYTSMFSGMVYLPDGSDALPNAFLLFLGEDIKFGATVVAIENTAQEVTVVYDTLAGRFRETADYAIVTLPFSLLRQIEVMPPFSPRKRRAMQQLQYDSACTLALQCRTRFWETEECIRGGSSITDRAIRNLYYPQSEQEAADIAAQQDDLAEGSTFSAPESAMLRTGRGVLLATQPGVSNTGANLPPEFVLRQAISTLQPLHPQLGQEVEVGLCHDWGNDPYAAGVGSLPSAGTLSRFNDIVAPEGRVYFAGEHCSKWYHRSVQGAIESAIVAATGVHQTKFSDGRSISQSYLEQIRHQIFQVADGYNPQTNPQFGSDMEVVMVQSACPKSILSNIC
jgi:monoamine oxidase